MKKQMAQGFLHLKNPDKLNQVIITSSVLSDSIIQTGDFQKAIVDLKILDNVDSLEKQEISELSFFTSQIKERLFQIQKVYSSTGIGMLSSLEEELKYEVFLVIQQIKVKLKELKLEIMYVAETALSKHKSKLYELLTDVC